MTFGTVIAPAPAESCILFGSPGLAAVTSRCRQDLDRGGFCRGSDALRPLAPLARPSMHMLNPYCGIDRDGGGVVRLTICNAGSLNILGSAVIGGVREGLQALATEPQIRALVIAGQSEKSM